MFTRDSFIWWVGIAASVLVQILAVGDAELITKYGFPEAWLPHLRLASLLLGIVSGVMKTSPRPHSEEGDAKITPSGR